MARRLDLAAPWTAGALLAATVLAVRYPPMNDLPLHEGMVAALAHWGDAGFLPPDLYALNLGHNNQLVYLLGAALAVVVGSTIACKVLVAAAVVATFVGAAHLAAYMGASRWAALVAAPAAVGWAFYWGFLPNLLGLALLLALLPALDRAAERATPRAAAAASGLVVLLALAHEASMACACAAIVVLALARPFDRRTPWRLAPVVVGAVLTLVEAHRQAPRLTPLTRAFASRVLWVTPFAKIRGIPENLFGNLGALSEGLLAGLAVVTVALFVAARRGERPAGSAGVAARDGAGDWRALLLDHRFAAVAALLFAAYLVAPYSVNFGAMLHIRFLAPAYLVGLLAIAPRGSRAASLLVKVPAVLAPVAVAIAALPQLARAEQDNASLETLLPDVERASAVALLHFGKPREALAFEAASAGNRVLAERGGRLVFSFAEYPIAPVVLRTAYRWDATVLRFYEDAASLRPAFDLRRIAFVLVHLSDVGLAQVLVRSFAPEGTLVGAEGEWMLFRSTVLSAPPDSPEEPLPVPAPETLQERADTLARH